MSLPPCKTAITSFLASASDTPAQPQTEQEMFLALSEDLARKSRHQRIARLRASVVSVWTGMMDRLFQAEREAKRKQDLIERLESFPPHLLSDIGVTRDTEGRFVYRNALGLQMDITTGTRPETQGQTGNAKEQARMAAVAGE